LILIFIELGAGRADRQRNLFSRREAPELCVIRFALDKQRAWGMPGAERTRSLACKSKKARKQVTTVAPGNPAFPAQWF